MDEGCRLPAAVDRPGGHLVAAVAAAAAAGGCLDAAAAAGAWDWPSSGMGA